jgi:hypothetical protein
VAGLKRLAAPIFPETEKPYILATELKIREDTGVRGSDLDLDSYLRSNHVISQQSFSGTNSPKQ